MDTKDQLNIKNLNSDLTNGIGIIRDNIDLNIEFNENDFETLNEISEQNRLEEDQYNDRWLELQRKLDEEQEEFTDKEVYEFLHGQTMDELDTDELSSEEDFIF